MKELLKALAFCMISMTICWVPILHINNWTMQWNGQPVKLFGMAR